ncbi:MAG: alpha-2-macroglobulin family protein, partial [Verrucomicrobiota bacterium]|nr:alpha-2-macroglobulin family protein [Verrucomicrobiota bacterium]
SIIRHSSAFYIGVSDFPAVQRIGAPLSFNLVAVRPDGGLYRSGVPVEVELSRVEWRTVKIKGAGGGVRFQNEKHLISQKKIELKTGVRESEPILTDLVPKDAGQYQLSFRSLDSSGYSILTRVPLYVSGNQSLAWDYHTEFKLDLVPDRELYKVGQSAQILLKAPFSGRALVTVERDRVLRSFQVNVSGNAPRIEVPLLKGDAPNVYVSVLLLRGARWSLRKIPTAEYRLGYCEIKVESPASRLEVSAVLGKDDYQPGQEAETSVYVKNGQEDPQKGVEVTLYAVDEGVLDLTGYQSPDLHAFFYEPMPLEVRTASSIPFMRTEDPSRVHYANKGHIIGGGGVGRLRRDFQAVAFWSASLLTDGEGKVQAKFIVPDSLTSYRVFAVAHKKAAFGSAEARFRVRLPLMVESALPRFARIGDRLIAKAVVYNQTSVAEAVTVYLETDDLIQVGLEARQKITVPPNASVAVRYPLSFVGQGKSRTVWRVASETSSDLKDSRESYIDIRHVSPLRKSVHFYRSKENIDDLLKPLVPELREAEGVYEVSACTSTMAEMEAASEYLLDYPHGCAEQTGSRLLPWLLLEEYRDVLPRLNLESNDQKENPVEHGVNRLLSMQTHEGGLAYWPGGAADGFASSYGGMVLAIAVKKGKKVPSEAMGRLGSYLVSLIKRPVEKDKEWGVHCLALYTLALMDKAQPAYHENAFSVRAKLPTAALSLLTAAVAESGTSRKMLSDLRETTGTSGKAFKYYGNSSQRLAMRLLSKGGGNGSASIAGRLSQLSREGHWGSTFANAWVIYAMTRFDQRGSKLHSVNAVVEFGGQKHPVLLNGQHRKMVVRLNNHSGPMRFRFLDENEDNLVYLTVRSAMRPVSGPGDTINRGLVVQRKYSRINPKGNSEDEMPMRVGDLVKVLIKVNVQNEEANYLAVEDGLPASLEPVFTRLKSQRADVGANHNWRIDHHELRKDRAVFYVNHPKKGEYAFEYIARVRAEGEVAAPPVKVEAMYNPDIMGLSARQKLFTR